MKVFLLFILVILWNLSNVEASDDGDSICDELWEAAIENKLERKMLKIKKCMKIFTELEPIEKCSVFEKLLSIQTYEDVSSLCSPVAYPNFEKEMNNCIEKNSVSQAQLARFENCIG